MTRESTNSGKNRRNSRITDKLITLLHRLALLGLQDKEIAEVVGVSAAAIAEWKRNYPEVDKAIKKGKKVADAKVARALYQKAIGNSHPYIVIMQIKGVIHKIPVVKHYPPDTKAAIFWLKNKTRDMESPWSDRFEITGKDGKDLNINMTNVNLKDLSDDELKTLMSLSEKLNIKGEEK